MPSVNRKSDDPANTNGTGCATPEETHHDGFDNINGANGVSYENKRQKVHGNGERERERIVVVGLGMVALSFM